MNSSKSATSGEKENCLAVRRPFGRSRPPIKVGGQTIDCARIELTATETKKKKRKVEATYWISEKVPGFLVRSRLKDTQDKVTTETSTEVLKFELKK